MFKTYAYYLPLCFSIWVEHKFEGPFFNFTRHYDRSSQPRFFIWSLFDVLILELNSTLRDFFAVSKYSLIKKAAFMNEFYFRQSLILFKAC